MKEFDARHRSHRALRRGPARGSPWGGSGLAATGVPEVDEATRAATLRFAPEVKRSDRAWILAAVANARPEAQRLIAEVDGLIEVRTDLEHDEAVGLAQMRPASRS